MVVCKFFQRGNCYYGNSCRFQHTYVSKYSYRAPQKNSQTAVNSSKSTGQSSAAMSLFRQAVQNTSAFDNISSHAFSSSQPARTSVSDRFGPQPSSVFGNQNHQGNQARSIFAQANQSVFGQPQPATNVLPTSNVFGTNNITEQIQINDDDIYSKIGELSQSDIDAFESDDFRLGFIPELPPPRLLCAM